MTARAVVTGGAGFIGSNLVDRLVDDGMAVLIVDDLSTGHVARLAEARRVGGVTFHQIDVRSPELHTVFERFRPEVVFHLAAQAEVRRSVEDPIGDAEINVLGTINVLEAAQRSGARRVVFASSGGAIYGGGVKLPARESYIKHPDSPYGVSKKVVADYFRFYGNTYDIDYVLLALANVYGPRQDPYGEAGVVAIFTKSMLEGRRPTIFGDGSQARDYVFVDDVVDAFARAMNLGEGLLLNIGTGIETSVVELFEMLARHCRFRPQPLFGDPKPGDIRRSVLDPTRAAKHLGWKAWTPLEDGLRQTVEWFRRN
ncbi:MAG TPA: NAD-dependent epimerase/dehydratase family protein [Acidimicrobiia bacterium]